MIFFLNNYNEPRFNVKESSLELTQSIYANLKYTSCDQKIAKNECETDQRG